MSEELTFAQPEPEPAEAPSSPVLQLAEQQAIARLHELTHTQALMNAPADVTVTITVSDLLNLESALSKMEVLVAQVPDALAALTAQLEAATQAEVAAKAAQAEADARDAQAREAMETIPHQVADGINAGIALREQSAAEAAAIIAQEPPPEEKS